MDGSISLSRPSGGILHIIRIIPIGGCTSKDRADVGCWSWGVVRRWSGLGGYNQRRESEEEAGSGVHLIVSTAIWTLEEDSLYRVLNDKV